MLRCTARGDVRWTQTVIDYVTDGQTAQQSISLDAKPPATDDATP